MAIKKGDFIKLSYTGSLDDGSVFDTTDKDVAVKHNLHSQKSKYGPVTIVVGENHVVPGLDSSFVGRETGEYTVVVKDVDGFGKKSAKKMKLVPAKFFKRDNVRPFVGLQVNIDNEMGIVRSVSGGRIVVDFNHPLASKDLTYAVTIHEIVSNPQEKVQAVFDLFSIPVESIAATEKEAVITTKTLLPEQLTTPFAKDITRLTGIENVSFQADGEKKE